MLVVMAGGTGRFVVGGGGVSGTVNRSGNGLIDRDRRRLGIGGIQCIGID